MKSNGNGSPQQCVENLLKISRGEVPYDRLRGIDAKLIDKPFATASPELVADVDWMLRTYEPRISSSYLDLGKLAAKAGDFDFRVDITIPRKE